MDKSWMQIIDRFEFREYAKGVKEFLNLAQTYATSEEIRCLCVRCSNNYFLPISQVERHLFIKGIDKNYKSWIFHGEEEDLIISDDDVHDPEQEDDFIDDVDVMLWDIWGGGFPDVPITDSFHAEGSPLVDTDSSCTFD